MQLGPVGLNDIAQHGLFTWQPRPQFGRACAYSTSIGFAWTGFVLFDPACRTNVMCTTMDHMVHLEFDLWLLTQLARETAQSQKEEKPLETFGLAWHSRDLSSSPSESLSMLDTGWTNGCHADLSNLMRKG